VRRRGARKAVVRLAKGSRAGLPAAGVGALATIARMPSPARARPLLALPLLALALLLPAASARADAAYDRVATAYAEGGGHLDPCRFTVTELEAALVGIPPQVANVVPDLRRAIGAAITTQERGGCKGRAPGSGAATPTTPASPVVTTPATPAPTTTPQPAATPARHHDRKPLLVAAIALGALLLLALLTWLWARVRGWDPAWIARQRHAWGEAGFRTTTTWSEFTDWLRLGR
jgi:hypothetical protein